MLSAESAWGSNLWLPASCEAVLRLPNAPRAAERGGGEDLCPIGFKLALSDRVHYPGELRPRHSFELCPVGRSEGVSPAHLS